MTYYCLWLTYFPHITVVETRLRKRVGCPVVVSYCVCPRIPLVASSLCFFSPLVIVLQEFCQVYKIIFKNFYFFHVFCLPAWMNVCVPHAWSSKRPEKRVLDTLEMEVQMVVSYHVGTGNWIQVPDLLSLKFLNLLFSPWFILYLGMCVPLWLGEARGQLGMLVLSTIWTPGISFSLLHLVASTFNPLSLNS